MPCLDSFGARASLGDYQIYRLDALARRGLAPNLDRLPYSIRILLEALLRHEDGRLVTAEDVLRLAAWNAADPGGHELPFIPARVIMQDFSGAACLADLAAIRDAVRDLGGDPARINPLIPADLVIDHTIMVDYFGSTEAAQRNNELSYGRNRERYEFLRWGGQAFANLRVVPPGTGIIHQVNLEYLAQGVIARDGELFPDTVVGTDSHTPMVNGLGVLGWGVGGIEAEAVMLGQPLYMVTPHVVGMRLVGAPGPGVTATDVVLTITQQLRRFGVVDKIVEFYGRGLAALTLPDRATIANMAPDYGATASFFPTDAETLRYLRQTNRGRSADLLERYAREQGLFRSDVAPAPEFSATFELDLASVEPSLAGPKKPEQRVALASLKTAMHEALVKPTGVGGYGLAHETAVRRVSLGAAMAGVEIGHSSVVLAAITSCTNTSNPALMIGAGLLAKKAVQRGLTVRPYVKTSLAPGSQVVSAYLDRAGLTPYLEQLGFYLTGYGCEVCVGNSGPLPEPVARAVSENSLVVAAVLSGNRNFEGRIHPQIRASFLASPPLVVAYALAGTVAIDLATESLGVDRAGQPVFLADIWPTPAEIADVTASAVDPQMYADVYESVFAGDELWQTIAAGDAAAFDWDPGSTYVRRPPFFGQLAREPGPLQVIRGARVLGLFGDGITTDHISPVGHIAANSPAARYLLEQGVRPEDFNQYGTRRANHEVMLRGTFANIRLRNLLLHDEGGYTLHLPDGSRMTIYDAAMQYRADGVPLVVIAGQEYGTGSARDWAAKGSALLGIRAVLAASFERIHRANLAGMGVLPLQFQPGENASTLGLSGRETYDVLDITEDLAPGQEVRVVARGDDGSRQEFTAVLRLDTPVEVDYYRNGGILPAVLRHLIGS